MTPIDDSSPDPGGALAGGAWNNAVGVTGTVVQAGTVNGGFHLKVVDDRGRRAVYRLGRDTDLAAPPFQGWHPDAERRALQLWEGWRPRASPVAVFRVHGESGSGLTATARLMCGDWLARPAPGRERVARTVNLGFLPVRRALQELLRDMGVPDEMLGTDPSSLFRAITRDQGPLALIVENPRSARDVERLLPGARGSIVVVVGGAGGDTVRHPDFGALDVRPVRVGPLSEKDALTLLGMELSALGVPDASPDERRNLLDRHGRTMRGVRRAALEHRRTAATGEEDALDSADAAYEALGPTDRMLVGLLALAGRPVGRRVLASALDREDTDDRLRSLVHLGLVEAEPGEDGSRFRLHTDLREIAEARWAGFDRDQGRDLLVQRYCAACHSLALDAHLRVMPGRRLIAEERGEPRTFTDAAEARRWLREERLALEQAVYLAAEEDGPGSHRGLRLCQVLWALYFKDSLFHDIISTHEPVLEKARWDAGPALAPPLLVSKVRSQLVRALLEMSDADRDRLDDAEGQARRAVEEASGDAGAGTAPEDKALLMSTAFEMLAEVLAAKGDAAGARQEQERSLALAHESGDTRAVLVERQKLARILKGLGAFEEAGRQLRDAWSEVKGLPDRDLYNEGRILMSLAELDTAEGDYASAEGRLAEALEAFRESDSRRRVADVVAQRAELRVAQGRKPDALRELAEARRMYEQLGRGVDFLRTDERIKALTRTPR
ncbi:tetratricopeptide repeat protein [Nocardiopsis sp. RSe5-2]|uniref:Tetratricopeptide repeat protein n=1 Tax=Nocardiopsis endophytica TaxID=3018445 RepID=A0ABT4U2B9_9ACTN|nr:tetratricopeptide repeat protein [Nocardiopsis endophytica]MDA2811098.1 tetratricopeptide repeat protein [Nocardiopsis endophytica]